jgi:Flp pilus assembly protein TadG
MRCVRLRGSQTVESLALVPALMMVALLVVFAGRTVDAHLSARGAADVAARVATRSASDERVARGESAGRAALTAQRSACASGRVQVASTTHGGRTVVTATVDCIVDRRGLAAWIAPRRVSATSSEVVDRYLGR